jgi:hypothetical protein
MRLCVVVLAVGGVALLNSVGSSSSNRQGKDPAVREIDVKGLGGADANGSVEKPTKITTVEELAKAIPDKVLQATIAKQVDFAKEHLLLFGWSGSGQDKLSFSVEKDNKGQVVIFSYAPGKTRDLRPHVHLYAIPKDAGWRVDKQSLRHMSPAVNN